MEHAPDRITIKGLRLRVGFVPALFEKDSFP